MPEPSRSVPVPEIRVGSAPNALQPIAGAERLLGAGRFQWLALFVVAAAAIGADQLTKQVVARRLDVGEAVELVGPFAIRHVHNTGIAFGLFADSTASVILLATLAVCAMLVFFWRAAARHPLLPAAFGLLIGGSISNLLDRLRLGFVTDFLELEGFPKFNLADTFIVVGVGLLFLSLLAADRAHPRVGAAPLSRS
ncbi:MAG: signal peptidase II [Gaiellales bacterium]